MKKPTSHLSPLPPNAKLMCWHPNADLAAFRIGDDEYLLANKRIYRFKPNEGHPAQLVSTLRTLNTRQLANSLSLLPKTFKSELLDSESDVNLH